MPPEIIHIRTNIYIDIDIERYIDIDRTNEMNTVSLSFTLSMDSHTCASTISNVHACSSVVRSFMTGSICMNGRIKQIEVALHET
jgi:hypothetical protein